MNKKKKTIIINSALVGVLASSAAIGAAVSLTSCAGGESTTSKGTPIFDKNKNKLVNADPKTDYPNVFKLDGSNLTSLKEAKFKLKYKKQGSSNYEFISNSDREITKTKNKLTITITKILTSDVKIICTYDGEEVGNLNYKRYPFFTASDSMVKPDNKNTTNFTLPGWNLDLINESDFEIYNPQNQLVKYEITKNSSTSKNLKLSINDNITRHMNLQCKIKSNNRTVATLDYKVPNFSDLMEDSAKDDTSEVVSQIPSQNLPAEKAPVRPTGISTNITMTDEYFMTTPQFKSIEEENKSKFFDISKNIVQTKLKQALGENYVNDYKIFSNLVKEDNHYTFSCQVNQKTGVRAVPPFTAVKFDFDYRKADFNIDNQNNLILTNAKATATFDKDDQLINTNSNYLNLNNNPTILKTKFEGVVKTENVNSKLEQWNRERLSNQTFITDISNKMQASIETSINTYKSLFNIVQDVGDQLASNPTIRDFLYSFETPVVKFLEEVKANQTFIDFVKGMFSRTPDPTTLKQQLAILKEKKILSKTACDVLTTGIDKAGTKNIIDYALGLSKLEFGVLLTGAFVFVPKKLKPLKPIITKFVNKLRDLNPNKDIGGVHIFDSIASPQMKYFVFDILPDLRKILPSGVCDIIAKIRPIWDQVSFTVENLTNFFKNLFNPKLSKSWGKDPSIKLSEYFKSYTKVEKRNQSISANGDHQTLNIDATYRLTFTNDAYISLDPLISMIESVDLSTLLKLLELKIPDFAYDLIDFFSNVGKAIPNYIYFKEKDYVEFRIKDSNAFLIPNEKGYQVKAKQNFQLYFPNSVDRTYRSLWGRYTVWQWAIRKLVDPYVDTVKKYYLKNWYGTEVMGNNIVDANNALANREEIYNGKNEITLSNQKIEEIKNNILAPLIRDRVNGLGHELSIELEGDVKRNILISIGLDPNLYTNKTKFILNLFPEFAKGAATNKVPRMADISLDMSFAVPLLVKERINNPNGTDADGNPLPLWITDFSITDITY